MAGSKKVEENNMELDIVELENNLIDVFVTDASYPNFGSKQKGETNQINDRRNKNKKMKKWGGWGSQL